MVFVIKDKQELLSKEKLDEFRDLVERVIIIPSNGKIKWYR